MGGSDEPAHKRDEESGKEEYERLREMYKSLDYKEYMDAIKGGFCMEDLILEAEYIASGMMELVGFEGEAVCYVNDKTDFRVIEQYYDNMFFGWNLYARPEGAAEFTLLETYDERKHAENAIESIKDALSFGATYYRLPVNY